MEIPISPFNYKYSIKSEPYLILLLILLHPGNSGSVLQQLFHYIVGNGDFFKLFAYLFIAHFFIKA
jgi:hypothetical protein